MHPTTSLGLTAYLRESIDFSRRFPKTEAAKFPKIVELIAADVLEKTGLRPSLDRNFLKAFEATIIVFCGSKLLSPATRVKVHLQNSRTISNRTLAKNAYPFESAEWYLAIFGLTIESDPSKIDLSFRTIAPSDSSARRLFDEVHGGLPRTELQILAIRKSIAGSLSSVREHRKSTRKPYSPEEKGTKATDKEHSFTSVMESIIASKCLPKDHPTLKQDVKTALNRFATGSNSRTNVISNRDADRMRFTFEALMFATEEGLEIPLTSIRRVLEAYALRPILNIAPDRLDLLRSRFKKGPEDYCRMIRKAVEESLTCDSKDSRSAFPDTEDVSMAYSYLNLDVRLRQMYTPSEIDAAAESIKVGDSQPHTGGYTSPYRSSENYRNWLENPIMARIISTRALKNAMSRVNTL